MGSNSSSVYSFSKFYKHFYRVIESKAKLHYLQRYSVLYETSNQVDPSNTPTCNFQSISKSDIFKINPCTIWHIGEFRKLFPKMGGVTEDIPDFSMLFPDFVISGHQTGFFCKLFPAEFHEYLPIFSQKRGMTHRLFRKLFPISDTRILDPVSFKLEYLYHV